VSDNKFNSKLSILRHVIQNERQYSFPKCVIKFFIQIYRVTLLVLYDYFWLILQHFFFHSERRIQISRLVIQNIISKWQKVKKKASTNLASHLWLTRKSAINTYKKYSSLLFPCKIRKTKHHNFVRYTLILETWWQIIWTAYPTFKYSTLLHLPASLIICHPSRHLPLGRQVLHTTICCDLQASYHNNRKVNQVITHSLNKLRVLYTHFHSTKFSAACCKLSLDFPTA